MCDNGSMIDRIHLPTTTDQHAIIDCGLRFQPGILKCGMATPNGVARHSPEVCSEALGSRAVAEARSVGLYNIV